MQHACQLFVSFTARTLGSTPFCPWSSRTEASGARTVIAFASALVVFAAVLGAQPTGPPVLPLFIVSGQDALVSVPRQRSPILRQRQASIDVDALEAARVAVFHPAAPLPRLQLNLFDDAAFEAVITHTAPTSFGYSLSGHLAGDELSDVTLVVNGPVFAGTVRTPDGTYRIRPLAAPGTVRVEHVDLVALPPEAPPLIPELSGPAPAPGEPRRGSRGGIVRDPESDRVRPILPPAPRTAATALRAPQPLAPIGGARVGVDTHFRVRNPRVEGLAAGSVYIEIEVATTAAFTSTFSSGRTHMRDGGETTVALGRNLLRMTQFYWRARATVDRRYSTWSHTATFATNAVDTSRSATTRIDVLIVYTATTRRALGGRGSVEAEFDLWEAETNQAYLKSGVDQRIRVVHKAEIRYDESSSTAGMLDDLTGDRDGGGLATYLRNRYAADIVTLVFGGSADYCGRASAWFAFNVVGWDCGAGTFAHELGHNMGVWHDRYEACSKESCDHLIDSWWFPPYAFGYVNQQQFERGAPSWKRWRTIMSYADQCDEWGGEWCRRLFRFSNTNQAYNGDPMGVPGSYRTTSLDGPADAVRVHNERRHEVADWRTAPCLRGSPSVRLQASNGQYVVAVNNGGGGVRADRPRPGPWGRFTLVDPNGGCVESGDTVSLHTSDGFYLRARQGGGATLDATAPRATPWARFVIRRTDHDHWYHYLAVRPPAVVNGDDVSLQAASGHYVVAAEGGGREVRADRVGVGPWETFRIIAIR